MIAGSDCGVKSKHLAITRHPQAVRRSEPSQFVLKAEAIIVNYLDATPLPFATGDQVSYSGLDGHGNVRFLLRPDGTAREKGSEMTIDISVRV